MGEVVLERNSRSGDKQLLSVTINQGVIKSENSGRKDNSSSDLSNYKLVKVGDIPYNSMRMWQGASGYSYFEGIVSPAYTVLIPSAETDGLFLSYDIKRNKMLSVFQRHSQGLTSDTWNLKYPQLSSIHVTVPKKNEQILIRQALTKLDALIAATQHKIDALEQAKKALLQCLFDQSWRFKGYSDPWEKRKFVQMLNNSDGLRRGPFGSALKKAFFVKESSFVVYEQQNAIYDRFNTRYRISEKKFAELHNFEVLPGDFLLSGAGTIGRIARVPKGIEQGVFNQALIRLRINESMTDSEFFLQFIRSDFMQKNLTETNPGSAIQNLVPMSELKNWTVRIPVVNEQRKIGSLLKKVDNLITATQSRLSSLELLKKALLQDLFI
ncbi:restriction endonuclease subunit S [Lacticaseibacillus paracasei]|uniref:restriction endonuclease subunit S n=1 Tax=Lacticaseibacillus paracasei TaxID=1597 RepID=UPI003A4D7D8B